MIMSHNNKSRGENTDSRPEIFNNSADKSSFSGSQISVQTNFFTARKSPSKFPAQIFRFLPAFSDILHDKLSYFISKMAETPNIINITPADHNDIEQIVLLAKQLLISHFDYDGEYFQLDVNHRQAMTDWVKYHLGAANQFILVARPDAGQPEICGFISGYIKPLFPWFKITGNKTAD